MYTYIDPLVIVSRPDGFFHHLGEGPVRPSGENVVRMKIKNIRKNKKTTGAFGIGHFPVVCVPLTGQSNVVRRQNGEQNVLIIISAFVQIVHFLL